MSAQKSTARGALSAFAGFIGMSVVAGLLVAAAVTPAIAVTGMAANNGIGAFEGLPEYLKIEKPAQNSTIYANKAGKPVPIATFYDQNRVEETWDNIGQNVKDATLSTEDPRFYQHGGIDITGTLRAVVSTYLLHRDTQGGSSITQQYVKNVRLMTCEVYNTTVGDPGSKEQATQDKKYQDCQLAAIEQTPDRKLQEMKMAIGLEKKYTKNEILAGYLNIVGFGGQIYGIEAAARYYFGKTAKTLTLPEAATLVAIVNNPSNLRIDQSKADNPGSNPENGYKSTLDRRDYVLDRMLINHKITQKEHDEAIKTKITPSIHPQSNGCLAAAAYNAAFYCDWVQHLIQDDTALGKTADDRANLLRRGGLQIYTPLNLNLQATAQHALSSRIPATHTGVDLGATNVSMEVGTGRVVTMVQNTPYYDPNKPKQPGATYINYNVDNKDGGGIGFQTGSTYKLFTLLEWLKEGHSLYDRVNAPSYATTFPYSRWHSSCPDVAPAATWPTVSNDGPGEGGNLSVMSATAASVNTAFATMGTQLDLCGIRKTAMDLGVHLAWPYQYKTDANGNVIRDKNGVAEIENRELYGGPASILGTNELAPLTLAAAYATIGNKGVYCSPIGIDKILDPTGKSLPVTKTQCKQAVDPNVAAGAAYALQGVMSNGTGQLGNPFDGTPILGKTGTTDNAAQNWLATSTTKVATTTWVGNVATIGGQWRNFGDYVMDDIGGRNAKLYVANPIVAALDKVYGGSSFPQATGSVLQAKQITVPDLSGKAPAEAKNILENLGFTYVDGGAIDGSQAAGTVEKTNPGAGSQTSVGSAVTVYTSKHNLTAIPNVVGQPLAQAVATLQAAGFAADTGGQTDPAAIVASQNPGANSAAKPGTKVTLTVKNAGGGTGGTGGGNGGGG
jgi:Membrane carboxypeptidase (penicillin-binding protein)